MDFPAWRRAQAFSQELMVTTYWSDGLTEKKQRLRSFGAKRAIQSPPACVKNSERRQRQFPKNQAKLTRLFFRGSHPRPSRPICRSDPRQTCRPDSALARLDWEN